MASEKLMLRIIVGHESTVINPPLQKSSSSPSHTHRWTVFVRGPHGESLDSQIIQKVIFQLHDDFPNAKRVLKSAPYEVTETGYAGFTIPIFLHFVACHREYPIDYDLQLSFEPHSNRKITKTLEFRDPKPALRHQLVKYGADVRQCESKNPKPNPLPNKKGTSTFENLFGPTLTINQPTQHHVQNSQKKSPRPFQMPDKVTPTVNSSPTKVSVKSRKHKAKDKELPAKRPRPNSPIEKSPTKQKTSRQRSSSETDLTDGIKVEENKKNVQDNKLTSPERPLSNVSRKDFSSPNCASRNSTRSSMSSPPSPNPLLNGRTDPNRPLDTTLVAKLCEDFGGNAADAETLVKSVISHKKEVKPSSPLFCTDSSSPEQSTDKEVETILTSLGSHTASSRVVTPHSHKDSPMRSLGTPVGLKLKIKPLPHEKEEKKKKKKKDKKDKSEKSSKKEKKHSKKVEEIAKSDSKVVDIKTKIDAKSEPQTSTKIASSPGKNETKDNLDVNSLKTEPQTSTKIENAPCKNERKTNDSPVPSAPQPKDGVSRQKYFDKLLLLQRSIMTLTDSCIIDKVANIVTHNVAYEMDGDFLEFDLCSLKPAAIEQLSRLFPI